MTAGYDRERAAKAALAGQLKSEKQRLASGMWILRDGQQASLDPRAMAWILHGVHALCQRSTLKRKLVALRRLITTPRALELDGGGYVVDVVATKGGGLVGFDAERRRVLHLRSVPFPQHYPERRLQLEKRYPGLSWRLEPDGRVLHEDFASGVPAKAWTVDDRKWLFQEFLARAATAAAEVADYRRALDLDGLKELLPVADWDGLDGSGAPATVVPWLLSHGDVTPLNVIGSGRDSWVLIDYEDARATPFFFDAVSLMIRDPALWDSAAAGEFDALWWSSLEVAGVPARTMGLLDAAHIVAIQAAEYHSRHHGGDFSYTYGRLRSRD